MALFAHDFPKWEFCVMNGIAFRLSIVCYDRLFSRKCSHLSIQAIRLFFKISGGGGFLSCFFSPYIFDVPSSPGRLSYYWKTWDARIGQELLHISSFFTFLSYFRTLWQKMESTELGYGRAWCSGTTRDLHILGTQFVPVSLDVSWAEI